MNVLRRDVLNCDFCNRRGVVRWSLPTLTFGSPDRGWVSEGDWAACDTCIEIVKQNDVAKLALYIQNTYGWARFSYDHLFKIYTEFYQNWSGNVVPFDEKTQRQPGDGTLTVMKEYHDLDGQRRMSGEQ